MTPQTIQLVQDSFSEIVPIADKAADVFYDRLFEIAPDVRPLFPEDMSTQKGKLMQILGSAICNLHTLNDVIPVLEDLGRRHNDYHVEPKHYDYVGQALLYALEQGLGSRWNKETHDAWADVYANIADIMIKAQQDAA